MKRIVIWTMLVACMLMAVSPVQAATANTKVNIVVDEKQLSLDVAPYIENNRVLVPVRGVFEKLGLGVSWDQKNRKAVVTGEGTDIELKLGSKNVTVNGKAKAIDVPVTMKDNRLFIPLRFVAENSGVFVKWNQASKTVQLKTNVVKDTEGFLKRLAEVELNSFSGDMQIEQTMSMDNEVMTMMLDMKMDMILDPLGYYQSMSMEMEGLEEGMTTETYLTKDGFFVFDSSLGKWIKYDDEMYEEIVGLSNQQLDPTAQFELMTKYYESVVVLENDDTYELHMSISGDGFQDLLSEMLGMPGLGLEGEDLFGESNIDVKKMEIVSVLDKETLFPVAESLDSVMSITVEGETVEISQKGEFSYSNHNELEEIVIPQDIIDEAISMEEALAEFEAEFEQAS
ncbi:copper amine oxidase N-terminal domain-containing protein [Halalkalibacter urbisdiaboli]|uniref:copper amine oxidase N-terminal domain-containing protein n=2 Tax=Halalkalibacter urbisdiaboli TaxID=1960589 RepID=UPI0013FD7031|nr:copper amine oxidase N-terminal domain-containing protein [Halalkalibacter urbisdiaboli]